MSNRPIASLTMSRKVDGAWVNYSVLSVWATENAGLYSISPDKGSEKYPPIGIVDAIKAFASGARFSIRVSSESQPRNGGGTRRGGDRRGNDDFGGSYGSSDDPEIPFAPFRKRGEW